MARTKLYPPSVDPGFPELGETPPGWSRTTFGDVLEAIERPEKLDPDRSYQLVTAKRSRGGIVSRGSLLGREVLTKTQFRIKEGDFLISRRQIIHGACGVVPPELDNAVVSNEYSSLRTRPQLLMEFLRHYSHTPYFQRTCFHSSHGVDVEKMIFKIAQWLKCPVDVPPSTEQKKIAAILSSVDDAIQTTQAVVDQLGVVKKALMAELLTRGIPGRHTKFKQTEIGEVPEGWQILPVGQAGAVDSGKAKDPRSIDKPRPYLRVANVFDGRIQTDDVLEMGFSDAEFRRFELQPGDVLLNEGQSIELVGRCSMYRGELPYPCAFQNALIRFRSTGAVCADYAEQYFRWCQHAGRFAEIATQTTSIAHLGLTRFASMIMAIPSVEEQQEIAAALAHIDHRFAVEKASRSLIDELKSALMSALLSGDLRVTPDELPT